MEGNKTGNMIYKIIRAAMIIFWVYVGMEKLWQLSAFKIALEQQPVISYLAPILFWLLPLMEIGIGVLLGMPPVRLRAWGWKVSTILIIVFSIYIGLGVLNVYEKKPCMCTSFLSNISWTAHLIFNLIILGLSITGWRLHHTVIKYSEHALTGSTNIALFLIGFMAMGAISYLNIHYRKSKDMWYARTASTNIGSPILPAAIQKVCWHPHTIGTQDRTDNYSSKVCRRVLLLINRLPAIQKGG